LNLLNPNCFSSINIKIFFKTTQTLPFFLYLFLRGGSGVFEIIHKAAERKLEAAAIKLGPLSVGGVVSTLVGSAGSRE